MEILKLQYTINRYDFKYVDFFFDAGNYMIENIIINFSAKFCKIIITKKTAFEYFVEEIKNPSWFLRFFKKYGMS